jgi:phosphate transport system substrate-binding protein
MKPCCPLSSVYQPRLVLRCLLFVGLLWSSQAAALQPSLEQKGYLTESGWTDYQAQGDLSGTIPIVGSDSMANLVIFWAEAFKKYYPKVDISIQSTGSSTAPPALTAGQASIGPMSRLMNADEIRAFETQLGYKPTPIAVAIDALAVFVHPDNPLPGLDLAQLDAIFSAAPSCGHSVAQAAVTRWGELGLAGDWAGQPLELFGRNSISGTYQYFKLHALCDGAFNPAIQERPGSASLVQAVSQSRYAMGYAALAYASPAVRVLPLARAGSADFVEPSRENAINGSYPLARLLYLYVNHNPAQPRDPLVREFIRMALSLQGQELVGRDGYAPLPFGVAQRELQKLAEPAPMP